MGLCSEIQSNYVDWSQQRDEAETQARSGFRRVFKHIQNPLKKVFETGLFNRSSTSPGLILNYLPKYTTFAISSEGGFEGGLASDSEVPNASSLATAWRL